MKRRVLMFKPRFAPLVIDDRKLHTVRPRSKMTPEAGTVLDMRQWIGRPYWSGQKRLCERVCSCVIMVKLDITQRRFFDLMYSADRSWWEERGAAGLERFARGDGFGSAEEMWDWFEAEHGRRVFEGIVIYWKPGNGGRGGR